MPPTENPPRNRPFCLGVCAQIHHTLGRGLLLGTNDVAERFGWRIVIFDMPDIDYIRSVAPDALIVLPETWRPIARYRWGDTIIIGIQQLFSGPRRAWLRVDDNAVGEMAADHLLSQGVESFGVFNFELQDWSARRTGAFRRRVLQAGGRCEQFTMYSDVSRRDRDYSADRVVRWLQSLPKPAGIFASCDNWAQKVIEFCNITKLRVPEDVALVGVDNEELLCELARPRLTSVEIPWRKIGETAANLVAQLQSGARPNVPVLIPPTGLILRHSSTVQAIPDPDVSAALAVIREHANRPLSVADILRRVPAHRHKLERGFRMYLKRTMTAEIRRVHVERAKRLLATSSLSIAEVALQCGFRNARKLAVAFRQEAGTTPSAYRSRFRPNEPSTAAPFSFARWAGV